MTYSSTEGRQRILDALAAAAQDVALALALVGEAYEHLDEQAADRLEAGIFQPLQSAYARAKRTRDGFAARHGMDMAPFGPAAQVAPSADVKALVDEAAEACARADETLGDLQDTMLPVEVGDAELRAGLAEVRNLLASVGPAARELTRTFGR